MYFFCKEANPDERKMKNQKGYTKAKSLAENPCNPYRNPPSCLKEKAVNVL